MEHVVVVVDMVVEVERDAAGIAVEDELVAGVGAVAVGTAEDADIR